MVFLAEQGFFKKGQPFDPAWQEMLNHATMKVCSFYRSEKNVLLPPATKLRQGNVFTPVCHSVILSFCPGGSATPRAETPMGRHPLGRHPLGRHPPGQTLPCAVHAGIRSTVGRYTSYWNAFLLIYFGKNLVCIDQNHAI